MGKEETIKYVKAVRSRRPLPEELIALLLEPLEEPSKTEQRDGNESKNIYR